MNILQTYYDDCIHEHGLDVSGRYLNSVINWLSIAYSCLTLKKNNPKSPLFFYGDSDIVHILRDLFKLPYDEYKIFDRHILEGNKYYCLPKIITYSLQNAPFIHIDTDIFVSKPFPQYWDRSDLIAQHQEHDSTFYKLVYDYLKESKVKLLDIQKVCVEETYINSYNLGIIGGRDINFFKEYIQCIKKFMTINHKNMYSAEQKCLFNVVFEQWMFYALAKNRNEPVSTFYHEIVKDFVMPNGFVPERIVNQYPIDFIHIMEHKKHVRCNSYVARNMLLEFPDTYERILKECYKKGIDVPQLSVPKKVIQNQLKQQIFLNQINQNPQFLLDLKLQLSPYVQFLELSNKQREILKKKDVNVSKISQYLTIKTFDAYMGIYHNCLYPKNLLSILLNFKTPRNIDDILSSIPNTSKKAFIYFIKQAIFDNILICI